MTIRRCIFPVVAVIALLGSLPAAVAPVVPHACTSFALNDGGYTVHAANFDFPIAGGWVIAMPRGLARTGGEPSTTGAHAKWVSQYGSIIFTLFGFGHTWGGMNEAGLTVSTMYLQETQSEPPDARPPLDGGLWLQYLLDNFSTVEQVLSSAGEVRVGAVSDHYLVCDRGARCAVVEFLDGEMVAYTGADLPVVALSNDAYAPMLTLWQQSPQPEEAGPIYSSSRRFVIAANGATHYDGAAPAVDYAFDVLEQVASYDGLSETQWSMVFDTENRRISFRTLTTPAVRTVDLGDFDFACDAPPLVLDVDAELAGDVRADFAPYDREVAADYLVRYFAAWAQNEFLHLFYGDVPMTNLTHEQWRDALPHAEDFGCAGQE